MHSSEVSWDNIPQCATTLDPCARQRRHDAVEREYVGAFFVYVENVTKIFCKLLHSFMPLGVCDRLLVFCQLMATAACSHKEAGSRTFLCCTWHHRAAAATAPALNFLHQSGAEWTTHCAHYNSVVMWSSLYIGGTESCTFIQVVYNMLVQSSGDYVFYTISKYLL